MYVPLKIPFLSRRVTAVMTDVRFLPGVYTHVFLNVFFLSGAVRAIRTRERPLSCMDASVPLEIRGSKGEVGAVRTLMHLAIQVVSGCNSNVSTPVPLILHTFLLRTAHLQTTLGKPDYKEDISF